MKSILKKLYNGHDREKHDTHDLLASGVEEEQRRLRRELAYIRAASSVYRLRHNEEGGHPA